MKPFGVTYHDDLMYVFYISYAFSYFNGTAPEIPTVERMTAIWASFAKTGELVPKYDRHLRNVVWDALTPHNHKYLEINETLAMKANLFADRYALWNRLFPLPPYKIPELD